MVTLLLFMPGMQSEGPGGLLSADVRIESAYAGSIAFGN